jgi:hypothetical protein
MYKIGYHKNLRTVHIPMSLIIPPLTLLERYFPVIMPFTVGQLSLFRYHGTIEQNELFLSQSPGMKNCDDMLRSSLPDNEGQKRQKALLRECRVFASYLTKRKPGGYICEKYCRGNAIFGMDDPGKFVKFDRLLVNFGKLNVFFTRIADAYSRIFYPKSLIRKKLTLLLAILESYGPTYQHLDSIKSAGKAMVGIKLGLNGILYFIILVLSFVVWMPVKIILGTNKLSDG